MKPLHHTNELLMEHEILKGLEMVLFLLFGRE